MSHILLLYVYTANVRGNEEGREGMARENERERERER